MYFFCLTLAADRPGIENLGNSCYFNSIIQCLASCNNLNDFLESNRALFTNNLVTTHYLDLINEIHAKKDRDITTPSPLADLHKAIRNIKFNIINTHTWETEEKSFDFSQQDASEFLRLILEPNFKETKSKAETSKILLSNIQKINAGLEQKLSFYIQNNLDFNFSLSDLYQNLSLRMTKDEQQLLPKKVFEGSPVINSYFSFISTFRNLLLPFYKNSIYHSYSSTSQHVGEQPDRQDFPLLVQIPNTNETSLADCITDYCKEETLDDANKWNCEQCKKEVSGAKKSIKLSKPSNLLVIVLKRYNNDQQKIDTPVSFPMNLTLEHQWLDKELLQKTPLTYSLIGISIQGGGTQGGHYWAYARDWRDGKWYYLNDKTSNEVSESEVLKQKSAYIFFYQKTDTLSPKSTNVLSRRKYITGHYNPPQIHQTNASAKLLPEKLITLQNSMKALKAKLAEFSKQLKKLGQKLKKKPDDIDEGINV